MVFVLGGEIFCGLLLVGGVGGWKSLGLGTLEGSVGGGTFDGCETGEGCHVGGETAFGETETAHGHLNGRRRWDGTGVFAFFGVWSRGVEVRGWKLLGGGTFDWCEAGEGGHVSGETAFGEAHATECHLYGRWGWNDALLRLLGEIVGESGELLRFGMFEGGETSEGCHVSGETAF